MPVTSALVEQRLHDHGYRIVHRTHSHGVFEHHRDRVVVPHHSPELSPWAARVIEQSLEARLGPGWLTANTPPPAPKPPARRLRLHLVIQPEPDHLAWNAFVVEEPRILTFAPTIQGAQTRAADAALAWFAAGDDVELVPVIQLDRDSQRCVDLATAGTSIDAARAHLHDQGFAEIDIDEILASARSARVSDSRPCRP